jgi:isopentenyl-diphosphate delta-isomerase
LNPIEITEVILVDAKDQVVGKMEKLEAHRKGLLHRAFSVFVFNSNKELLLQKRAIGKYHSEGLWTNTCCSHPSPNESLVNAGKRRLQEEMGFSCELKSTFSFIYNVKLDNELIEHELDHVLIGAYNENPVINSEEASDFSWENLETLKTKIRLHPSDYTSWFKIIINEHYDQLNKIVYESL